jgi:hypothetical protein
MTARIRVVLTELLSAVGVASNVQSSPACNGRPRGTALSLSLSRSLRGVGGWGKGHRCVAKGRRPRTAPPKADWELLSLRARSRDIG